MSPGYNAFSALNEAKRDRNYRGAIQNGETKETLKKSYTYQNVLNYVQTKISESEEYNKILSKMLDSDEGSDQLKNIITTLLQKYPIPLEPEVIDKYQVRIYEDMMGFGILTPYLDDPDVEEINVYGPGPRQIEVIGSRGRELLEEGFPNAEAVYNLVKRAVRKGNMIIDAMNPRVDSYIGGGTRVSAMIPPIVREDKGAVASFRKQTKAHITRDMMIKSNMAMPEEFEFIELCAQNKVSGAIVGATGSGKTTLLNYLMSDYVTNTKGVTRVYIIEEARELQLPEDAQVFYTATCGDAKAGNVITAPDLLKSALRFHPTFISCAEMRGEEAMNAMTAAQTGHIVWSTFHADSGRDAYTRLLTMCKMSGTDLSEGLLMRNLVQAFPIIVSSQQMKDGKRKITGIFEATGVDGINVVGHYIYHLEVSEYVYDDAGNVVAIHGAHRRTGDISDELAQRIFDECGQLERVARFARPGWMPESMIMKNSNDVTHGASMAF